MPDYFRYAATAAGLLQDIGRHRSMREYGGAAALAPAIGAIPGQIGGFLERRDQRANQQQQSARDAEFDDLRRRQAQQQLAIGQNEVERIPADNAAEDQTRAIAAYGHEQDVLRGEREHEGRVKQIAADELATRRRKSLKIAAHLAGVTNEERWDSTKAWMNTQGMDVSQVPENMDQNWLNEARLGAMDSATLATTIGQRMSPQQQEPVDFGTVDGFLRHQYGDNPTSDQLTEGTREFHRLKAKAPDLGSTARIIQDEYGENATAEQQMEVIQRVNKAKKPGGQPPVPEEFIPYFAQQAASGLPYSEALNDLAEVIADRQGEGDGGMDPLKVVEALRTVYGQAVLA